MKKLFVNKEACIGCGSCIAIDSEHFDFDDDGLSMVISQENIESDNAKNAMSSCPTNAISYSEDENDEKEECCEHCQNKCDCKNSENE